DLCVVEMSNREESDVDDDFSDLYKEYTGPLRNNTTDAQEKTSAKRPHTGSDEEVEARDPNAVPTDFTSREAKVWEAKSKATERNWKKRKEEEQICKLCGESGHFTQGCPSTLGANRKSQDFFERVPAREPHVKALFSEKVVRKIEDDIGCKIKIEEKFIIVSGKDKLILKRGVDAVHKVKDDGAEKRYQKPREEASYHKGFSPAITHSRSSEHRSPAASRMGRSNSQSSNPSPRGAAYHPNRNNNTRQQEKIVEDSLREDIRKISSGSTQ
ncbi:hypothetical protein M569_04279, partial [Genlisea aurea]